MDVGTSFLLYLLNRPSASAVATYLHTIHVTHTCPPIIYIHNNKQYGQTAIFIKFLRI